jgi:hypothetical protein
MRRDEMCEILIDDDMRKEKKKGKERKGKERKGKERKGKEKENGRERAHGAKNICTGW